MDLYLSKEEWRIVQTAILIWGSFNSWHTARELYDKYQARQAKKRTQAENGS